MTDEFTTPVTQVADRRATAARVGLLGATAAAAVAAAILIFGGSAAPTGTLAAANTVPTNAGITEQDRGPGGFMGGMMGERGGGITITNIAGSNVSLETADGWKRTISVAGATLTKGTATIALSDLKVGDEVRFEQTRGTDGTFTITRLNVVLPHAGGTVTAIAGSTITVTERDGTTATIQVSSSTTFEVGMTTGKALADVKVGMVVNAVGTRNSDGSLAASAVRAFDPTTMPGRGHDGHDGHGPMGNDAPDAAPGASAGTSAG